MRLTKADDASATKRKQSFLLIFLIPSDFQGMTLDTEQATNVHDEPELDAFVGLWDLAELVCSLMNGFLAFYISFA